MAEDTQDKAEILTPAAAAVFGTLNEGPMISLGHKLQMLAKLKPNAPAVTCEDRTLTYAQLHKRTNRIAHGLQAVGVKQGDFVTIALPNGIPFLESFWALWKIGATVQPVSYRLPKHELDQIVELANSKIVIADPGFATDLPRFTTDDLHAKSEDDSDFDYPISPVSRALTSGGSTGRPKLILSGARGVSGSAIPEVGGWRIHTDEICILPGPLYHSAPFGMALSAISMGAHLILTVRFDAEKVLQLVEQYKATWIYLVPTMMSRVWDLPNRTKYDVSTIKTQWHLAAPCPPWLKEAFINWLGPDAVMELYAGTEAQASTVITGREWLAKRGSVGQVRNGAMQAFDDDGNPLPPGVIGEIYMKRPEGGGPGYQYIGATARTLPGGWESLGDIGYIDADGYVFLSDRRTDMILVGGSNVYPAEIEAALEENPLVESVAVIGLPDADMGNTIHAIVQPRAGLTDADLRKFIADKLVAYKQPRTYEFVTEPLRNEAGKVRRTQLRDERIAKMKTSP